MSQTQNADRQWRITERWQQYEGEARANLLRMATIGLFYTIHLMRYWSVQWRFGELMQFEAWAEVSPQFHLQVTLLVAAWAALAAGVHLCLNQQVFPRWLPPATTCLDLIMLTSVLMVSNGPRSPLVAGYFLILVLAALRFNLSLVRLATGGAAIGYICLLGLGKWPDTFGKNVELVAVPRYHQLVVIVALLAAGVLLGQVVRRVRGIAADYAQRLESAS